jgi:chemotaxis protein MotB
MASQTPPPGGLNDEDHGHDNEERWLLTYADMMTLLVAFFIMMYSMSVLNLAKFKQIALSIKSGFMGEMEGKKGQAVINEDNNMSIQPIVLTKSTADESGGAKSMTNETSAVSANDAIFANLKKQLIDLKISKKLQGLIDIQQKEGNIYIVIITDKIFFKPGDAVLTDPAKEILTDIGGMLKPLKNEVSVEGYTSVTPPAKSLYRNNWELSAARAVSVISFFQSESKIEPARLSLTGYGQWRPVFGAKDTDEKNDRVLIAVMKKTFRGGK